MAEIKQTQPQQITDNVSSQPTWSTMSPKQETVKPAPKPEQGIGTAATAQVTPQWTQLTETTGVEQTPTWQISAATTTIQPPSPQQPVRERQPWEADTAMNLQASQRALELDEQRRLAREQEKVVKETSEQMQEDVQAWLQALAETWQKVDRAALRRVLKESALQFWVPQDQLAQSIRSSVSWLLWPWLDTDAYLAQFNQKAQKWQQLSTMTNDAIADQWSSWQLSNDDVDSLKQTNPAKYQEVLAEKQDIDSNKQANADLKGESVAKEVTPWDPEAFQEKTWISKQEIDSFMGWKQSYIETYDQVVNTQEVTNLTKEAWDLKTKMEKLDEEAFNKEKEIRKRFWNSLSKWALDALVRDELDDINEEKRTLGIEYNGVVSTLDSLREQWEQRFWLLLQQKKDIEDKNWREMQFAFQRQQADRSFDMQNRQFSHMVDKDKFNRYVTNMELWRKKEDRALFAQQTMFERAMLTMDWPNALSVVTEKQRLEAQFGTSLNYNRDPDTGEYFFYDPKNPWEILGTYKVRLQTAEGTQTWSNNWTAVTSSNGMQYKKWQQIEWPMMGGIASWALTQIGWPTRTSWIDIAGKKWDPLFMPANWPWWEIVGIGTDGTKNNFVKIRMDDWIVMTYNHLDSFAGSDGFSTFELKKWMRVEPWMQVGTMWNSGNVMSGGKWLRRNGKVVNQALLDQWRGTHLDLVAEIDWQRMSMPDLVGYLDTWVPPSQIDAFNAQADPLWWFSSETRWIIEWGFSISTVSDKNKSQVFEELDQYRSFIDQTESDPWRASIMKSAGKKAPTSSDRQKLWAIRESRDMLDVLKEKIKNTDTGPIVWALREKNPYDAVAQEINTLIDQTVPWLARWVFWEVWVLTDADVNRYRKTLPNLTNTQQVNDFVLWVLEDNLNTKVISNIKTLADTDVDVSWFLSEYDLAVKNLKNQETWWSSWFFWQLVSWMWEVWTSTDYDAILAQYNL